jgi:hypothetical protein
MSGELPLLIPSTTGVEATYSTISVPVRFCLSRSLLPARGYC